MRGREETPSAVSAGWSALISKYLSSISRAHVHQGSSSSPSCGCCNCHLYFRDEQTEPHRVWIVHLCIHSPLSFISSFIHPSVYPLCKHLLSPFSVPAAGLGTEHPCGIRSTVPALAEHVYQWERQIIYMDNQYWWMHGDNKIEWCGRECLGGGMLGKAPKRMWRVRRSDRRPPCGWGSGGRVFQTMGTARAKALR